MKLTDAVFSISNEDEFKNICLDVFHYQYENNPVYRAFTELQKINPHSVDSIDKIPFLPIGFFKTQRVSTSETEEIIFTSSGTGQSGNSKHYVQDLNLYRKSFLKGFNHFFGDAKNYRFFALLPGYIERDGSSLIFMVKELMDQSADPANGFYLDNVETLLLHLKEAQQSRTPFILLGVSFALLDLAEKYSCNLSGGIIMETGGMKGRRKELVREELHHILKKSFSTSSIYSEYGMTELLSQGYSKRDGLFFCPPWMRILIRDTNDPLSYLPSGKTGGINVIDLANIYSCSFIATQDLGKLHADGSFEVLGRFDNSDIRGCNLMIE